MTITLYAQPYDICATGFYFETADDYDKRAADNRNEFGDLVEEYEIQFIDGDDLDADLAKAFDLNQANFRRFLEAAEDYGDDEKLAFIIAVGECGYSIDGADSADVDIYRNTDMRELAEQFVDEGMLGDVPANLACYLDYDAIARDLSMDYTETEIAGQRLVYRCG